MTWAKIAACILVFILALGLTLYPFISNILAEKYASTAMAAYSDAVSSLDTTTLESARQAAEQANRSIGTISLDGPDAILLLNTPPAGYEHLLNVNGDGIMGYIRIPAIDVTLPIYHGVEGETLEHGVGHLPGSSLPVGGETTHAVLAAHSGLATQRMFTDLEQVVMGDKFYITVLGDTLAYEVDQILVVEPDDTSALGCEVGQDLVTLITCTPYGVNTHRLLVRGKRIPYEAQTEQAAQTKEPPTAPSTWRRQYIKGLALGGGILAVITITAAIGWMAFRIRNSWRRCGKHEAR